MKERIYDGGHLDYFDISAPSSTFAKMKGLEIVMIKHVEIVMPKHTEDWTYYICHFRNITWNIGVSKTANKTLIDAFSENGVPENIKNYLFEGIGDKNDR